MLFRKKKKAENSVSKASTMENTYIDTTTENTDTNADKSELNEELRWIQRMVSHNVRMPMSVIRGYGDLLRQDLLKEEEKVDAINSICDNIMYLDQILNVIFEYGRPEEICYSKVNVSDVIKKVTGYVSEIARKSNISLILRIENDDIYIDAEIIPVMRIFYQLLENAFKYLSEGNSISISAYETDKQVLVVYKDDGIGMNQKELKYVLEDGFRGSNSGNKKGSGFGLYDLKNTVSKYGGTIEVKSSINEGFSVFMVFPAADMNESFQA